ncbi:succinylglutamate desuccinylase/aspartoacylase family protein [Microvirga roseola]|uniref:succinylglutamate desuccinylase/aspartoacylase family protein n=1 Tax=Microvirga roseola TaxID=2883126 RepID=UPI001E50FF25|nr:succinylglutamate desuccinylase/aspartoacylase family protein [Microvirga roseola]
MATLNIDWERNGRQASYIHVPSSTNASAWQNLRIPVFVIRNGAGPTTLLLGGSHGDEYEGPVALSKFVHSVDPDEVRGTVTVVPAINLPAVMAGARLSPLDGCNLNREFPGRPLGTVTQRIAHFITTELVPRADNVIDLHSGGRSLHFQLCTLIHEQPEAERTRSFLAAAEAFAAPLTVVIREPHADVMLDDVVEKSGRLMLSSELGGSGIITPESARIGFEGLLRVLRHFGNLRSDNVPVTETPPSRIVSVPGPDYYVHADDTAVFEPALPLGSSVGHGTVIGYLHYVDRIERKPDPVLSPQSGLLLCLHGQGLVHRNDTLVVIAVDHAP